MSMWSEHDLTEKVIQILTDVHCNNDVHHFGRPYVSAYQIAIEMQRRFPGTVSAIGKPIGGAGTGQHNSLAQYLSNELSKQIERLDDEYPVEGAFFSNEHASAITFTGAEGAVVTSSLVGTDFDMALYRLR
ncbi:MAG: hypothetical protein JJE52_00640 [Acidimicrobiia bacterium]|nr:hypothetical protein [Acidimicrobiia bacterium]